MIIIKIKNNIEGLLGKFILFNKCFITKEKNKITKLYEENLFELNCNYEIIIYI